MTPGAARSVARCTGWIILDRAAAALCGIVSLIIISRSLGAEGLGHLAVAQTFVPLFLFLANWGMGTSVVAELSRQPSRVGHLLGTAVLLRLPLCAAAWIACLIGARVIGYSPARLEEILIYSLILWLPIVETVSAVFPVALRMRAPSIISIASSGLQLGLVALGGSLQLGVRWFLGAILIASLVRSGGTAIMALRHAGVPLGADVELARRLIRSGTLLSGAALFTLVINGLPTLMLERLHGAEEAGLYSVGARVLVIVYALPIALMTTVLPLMAREFQQDPHRLQEIYTRVRDLLFWAAIPVGVGATLLAGPAIALVFGPEFSGARVPFSILLWQPVLVFPWIAASNALIAQRRERANLFLAGMTSVVTVLLCLAFIPAWRAPGAAIASLLTYLPVALLSVVMVRRAGIHRRVLGVEAHDAGMAL